MPIWLRKFTFNQLQTFYEEQQNQQKKLTKGKKGELIKGPNIKKPTYTTRKASK